MAPTRTRAARSVPHRIGWWVLTALTALMLLNHAVGVFAFSQGATDRFMFVVFALLNAYALVVLLIPFRRGEPWAWWLSQLQVAAFALCLPLLDDPAIGWFYLGIAAVLELGLALTYPGGRPPDRA